MASNPNAIACDNRSITSARRIANRVLPSATNTPLLVGVVGSGVGGVPFIVV
jgi:hypothetical protein